MTPYGDMMTPRYALAFLLVAACTQVRGEAITHSGAQTTPGPCAVGEARCHGRVLAVCGRDRWWPATPAGLTCRHRCVTDARGPHCAGPIDGGADVSPVDDAGQVEDAPAVEVLVLPIASPDDAGE